MKAFVNEHSIIKWWIKWKQINLKRQILRNLLKKYNSIKEQENEGRYASQYKALQKCLNKWRMEARKFNEVKKRRIKLLTAENYFKSRILSKFYFKLKSMMKIAKGLKILAPVIVEKTLRKRFNKWKEEREAFQEATQIFKDTRRNVLLFSSFNAWKQETLKNKLSKMFYQRKVMQIWLHYATQKRIYLPYTKWINKTKRVCLFQLKAFAKVGWNKRRGNIILKELHKRHSLKLQKTAFAGLLDNVVIRKK